MKISARVIDLNVTVPEKEVLRMMGCGRRPCVPESQRTLIARLMAETHALIRPRAVYTVRNVETLTDHVLTLQGCRSFHGPIAGFLRPSRRVAVFVVTIGEQVESLARQRNRSGEALESFVLDAIGSAAVDVAADAMAEFLRDQETGDAEALTPPFSPGYCGMPLEEQRVLFSIVHGKSIGVKLTASSFMQPIKSISGLVGIGPREEVDVHGNPCRWCELTE